MQNLRTRLLDNVALMLKSSGDLESSIDADLAESYQKTRALELVQGQEGSEARASKRLCLSEEGSDESLVQTLLKRLSTILGCSSIATLTELQGVVQ